jgi:septal ring factor EnvC (AmiA/AmiB activator)
VFARLLEAAGEVAAEQTRMLRMCAEHTSEQTRMLRMCAERGRQEARTEADVQATCVRDEEAFAEAEVCGRDAAHPRALLRMPYAVCRLL